MVWPLQTFLLATAKIFLNSELKWLTKQPSLDAVTNLTVTEEEESKLEKNKLVHFNTLHIIE